MQGKYITLIAQAKKLIQSKQYNFIIAKKLEQLVSHEIDRNKYLKICLFFSFSTEKSQISKIDFFNYIFYRFILNNFVQQN